MSGRLSATKPFSAFEWLLAGRYLRSKRRESVVSVISVISFLGIMIGVMVLIVVMAVMNGFRIELLSKILGFNGHIVVNSQTVGFENFDPIAERIRKLDGVLHVSPLVEGQVMTQSKVNMKGALVRGIRKEDLANMKSISENLTAGTLDDFEGSRSVFVGSRLAQELRLNYGDKVLLVSPRGANTAMGNTPRRKAYRIAGMFELGMSEYDASIVLMPFEQAQKFFSYPDQATSLDIRLADPDDVELVRPQIVSLNEPINIYDWKQTNQSFVSALMVERNVMFMILTLIILIAAMNIISGLVMMVKDKGKDIAILRTMGASSGSVMRVFFIAGSSVGFVGTVCGFLLGVLFCTYIEPIRQFIMRATGANLFDPSVYWLYHMPAEMDSGETIAVLIMSLTLSFLATLYPAWRAAKLDPVEALRYE